jgi:hypothetical protein
MWKNTKPVGMWVLIPFVILAVIGIIMSIAL